MGRHKTNTPESLKKYKADYYQRNKAHVLAKSRQWVLNNREKSREHKKKWDDKNKEYKKQYALKNALDFAHKKNYEIRNREKVRLAKDKWNRENRDYQKLYLKLNPEKFRAASLRRRASKISNSTQQQIDSANRKIIKMLESEFSTCPYCKKSFKTSAMDVDHIFPLSKGGSHSAENIAMACPKCNGSKGDKILFVEWTPPHEKKIKNHLQKKRRLLRVPA